ncbi:MAG TPA: hypothetical protein VK053_17800 [Jiangellaceae bacterium]|nr:hypothetical protein [Jiangellaceae bacterium]
MTTALVAVASAAEHNSAEGVPAAWFGIGTGIFLLLCLIITLAFGKGREHS